MMHRLKRILVGSLVTVMIMSIVACSGAKPQPATGGSSTPTSAPKEKAKLSVMLLQDNPGQHILTQEQIQKWAQAKNVEVTIDMATQKDMATKVATTIESGSGPDLFVTANYGPRLYGDALLDLSDVAQELDKTYGGFFPLAKEAGLIDGQWKGIPVYIYMHLLLYRKDLLQAAGEKVPDTWEDFARVAKKLQEANKGKGVEAFGVSYGRSQDGQQFLMGLLWSFGSKMVATDGKTITFDSPETVAGVKFAADLFKNKVMPGTVMGWDDSTNNKEMLAGRLAMTVNGSSIKAAAKKDFPELYPNIGLAIYPKGPAGRASFPGVYLLSALKTTKQPELVKDLIKYLFKPENYGPVITHTNGAIGSPLKSFSNLEVWKDPDNKAMLDAVETGHLAGWPGPISKAAAAVENEMVIGDIPGDVINNGMTPEQAVKKAAERIKTIYAEKGN